MPGTELDTPGLLGPDTTLVFAALDNVTGDQLVCRITHDGRIRLTACPRDPETGLPDYANASILTLSMLQAQYIAQVINMVPGVQEAKR